MHYNKLLSNQKGATLIETVAGITVIVLVMQFYGMAMVDLKRATKRNEIITKKEELATDIVNDISNFTRCNELIADALKVDSGSKTTWAETSLDNVADNYDTGSGRTFSLPDLGPFKEKFSDSEVNLEAVNLKYTKDAVDPKNKSQSVGYTGEMTFHFRRLDTTIADGGNVYLRPIKVPFKLFSEINYSTIKWRNVTCSTTTSASNAQVAEICALYGGTLTNGTHCDFTRYVRAHRPTANSKIVPPDVNGDVAQRLTLADTLCYIDTLNALAPDQNFVSVLPDGSRDYTKDYYKKNYVTRFCKVPTGIKANTPLPFSNLTGNPSNLNLSADVSGLLTENPPVLYCPYRYNWYNYNYYWRWGGYGNQVVKTTCQKHCDWRNQYRDPKTKYLMCRVLYTGWWELPK